jgi:hypothetical protein
MRTSIFSVGPYYNGIRPKKFLSNLSSYYNKKAMTSNGGKQFNAAYGQ